MYSVRHEVNNAYSTNGRKMNKEKAMECVRSGKVDELNDALSNTVNLVELASTLTKWYDLIGWSTHLQSFPWKECQEDLIKVNPALLAFLHPLGKTPPDVVQAIYAHEKPTYDEETMYKVLKYLKVYGVDITPKGKSDVYDLLMESDDEDDMDTSSEEEEEEDDDDDEDFEEEEEFDEDDDEEEMKEFEEDNDDDDEEEEN